MKRGSEISPRKFRSPSVRERAPTNGYNTRHSVRSSESSSPPPKRRRRDRTFARSSSTESSNNSSDAKTDSTTCRRSGRLKGKEEEDEGERRRSRRSSARTALTRKSEEANEEEKRFTRSVQKKTPSGKENHRRSERILQRKQSTDGSEATEEGTSRSSETQKSEEDEGMEEESGGQEGSKDSNDGDDSDSSSKKTKGKGKKANGKAASGDPSKGEKKWWSGGSAMMAAWDTGSLRARTNRTTKLLPILARHPFGKMRVVQKTTESRGKREVSILFREKYRKGLQSILKSPYVDWRECPIEAKPETPKLEVKISVPGEIRQISPRLYPVLDVSPYGMNALEYTTVQEMTFRFYSVLFAKDEDGLSYCRPFLHRNLFFNRSRSFTNPPQSDSIDTQPFKAFSKGPLPRRSLPKSKLLKIRRLENIVKVVKNVRKAQETVVTVEKLPCSYKFSASTIAEWNGDTRRALFEDPQFRRYIDYCVPELQNELSKYRKEEKIVAERMMELEKEEEERRRSFPVVKMEDVDSCYGGSTNSSESTLQISGEVRRPYGVGFPRKKVRITDGYKKKVEKPIILNYTDKNGNSHDSQMNENGCKSDSPPSESTSDKSKEETKREVKMEIIDEPRKEKKEDTEEHYVDTLCFRRARNPSLPGDRLCRVECFLVAEMEGECLDAIPAPYGVFTMKVNDMSTLTRPPKVDLHPRMGWKLGMGDKIHLIIRVCFSVDVTERDRRGRPKRKNDNEQNSVPLWMKKDAKEGTPAKDVFEKDPTVPFMFATAPIFHKKKEGQLSLLYGKKSMVLIPEKQILKDANWQQDSDLVSRLFPLAQRTFANPFLECEVLLDLVDHSESDETENNVKEQPDQKDEKDQKRLREMYDPTDDHEKSDASDYEPEIDEARMTKKQLNVREQHVRDVCHDPSGLPIFDFLKAFAGFEGFADCDSVDKMMKKNMVYDHDKKTLRELTGMKIRDILNDPTLSICCHLLRNVSFPSVIYYRFPSTLKDKIVATSPSVKERPREESYRHPRPSHIENHEPHLFPGYSARYRYLGDFRRRPFFQLVEDTDEHRIVRVLTWKEVKTLPPATRWKLIKGQGKRLDSFHSFKHTDLPGDDAESDIQFIYGLHASKDSWKERMRAARPPKVNCTKAKRIQKSSLVNNLQRRALLRKMLKNGYEKRNSSSICLRPRREESSESVGTSVASENGEENSRDGKEDTPMTEGSEAKEETDAEKNEEAGDDDTPCRIGSPVPESVRLSSALQPLLDEEEDVAAGPSSRTGNGQERASSKGEWEFPHSFVPAPAYNPFGMRKEEVKDGEENNEEDMDIPVLNGLDGEIKQEKSETKKLNGLRNHLHYKKLSANEKERRLTQKMHVPGLTVKESNEFELLKMFKLKPNKRSDVKSRVAAWKTFLFPLSIGRREKLKKIWMRKGVDLNKWSMNPLTTSEYEEMDKKIDKATALGLVDMKKEYRKWDEERISNMDEESFEDYQRRLGLYAGINSASRREQDVVWVTKQCSSPDRCVICQHKCYNLFALMMHYTLTHTRFAFRIIPNLLSGETKDGDPFPVEDAVIVEVKLDPSADTTRELVDLDLLDDAIDAIYAPESSLRRSKMPIRLRTKKAEPVYMATFCETRLLRERVLMDLTLFTKSILCPETFRRLEVERHLGKPFRDLMEFSHFSQGPWGLGLHSHLNWIDQRLRMLDNTPSFKDRSMSKGFQALVMYFEQSLLKWHSTANMYMKTRLFLRCNLHIILNDTEGKLRRSLFSYLVTLMRMDAISEDDFLDLTCRIEYYSEKKSKGLFDGDMDYDPLIPNRSPLKRYLYDHICVEYRRARSKEEKPEDLYFLDGDMAYSIPKEYRKHPGELNQLELYQVMLHVKRTDHPLFIHWESELRYFFNEDDTALVPEWMFPPLDLMKDLIPNLPPTFDLDPRMGPMLCSQHYFEARSARKREDRQAREKNFMRATMHDYFERQRAVRLSIEALRTPMETNEE